MDPPTASMRMAGVAGRRSPRQGQRAAAARLNRGKVDDRNALVATARAALRAGRPGDRKVPAGSRDKAFPPTSGSPWISTPELVVSAVLATDVPPVPVIEIVPDPVDRTSAGLMATPRFVPVVELGPVTDPPVPVMVMFPLTVVYAGTEGGRLRDQHAGIRSAVH
jgi:hypothetical protein